MISSFGSVATIFMMIALGYVLASKGILNKETNQLFSKLVIRVALPLMIISSLPNRFTQEELMNSSMGILVAFLCIIFFYLIAYSLARLIKVDKRERGLFCVLIAFCNSLFIGLPINTSLFGDESAPYVFLYYIANTCLFWTIGVYNIRKYSDKEDGSGIKDNIKRVFSPPLLGFIAGVILIIFKIELPYFVNHAFVYVGQLSTPLSMFFIGTVIYNIDLKEMKINRMTTIVLLGRFVISPIIVIVVLSFFELPGLLNKVFIIQGAGPIISQVALVAEYYDVNSKFAAFMVGLSTILYMFIIPIYVYFIG